eukprot:CAMPEP_0171927656 /NCGR_PEP_ID=MMETSP0993-20121228/26021_1 /TAXON_ID=483369 /ORGANISM="non described non described, Strain CCMP2098" /LENGTH=63 /DNA_ID=CAMNT_0012566777 /DNA_START=327 /DNA_END=518 /DNA_ORIENTATION=-
MHLVAWYLAIFALFAASNKRAMIPRSGGGRSQEAVLTAAGEAASASIPANEAPSRTVSAAAVE